MLSRPRASFRASILIAASLAGAQAHAIIGGTADTANSVYQYMGTFTRSNQDAYLGTPIAPHWFVTAAHDYPEVGDNFTNTEGSYTITNVVNVPNGMGGATDIALVQVGGTFTNVYGYGSVAVGTDSIAGGVGGTNGTLVSIVGSGAHSSGIGVAPGGYARYVATNTVDDLIDVKFGAPYNEESVSYLYDLDDGTATHNVTGSQLATANEGGVADHDSGGGWFVKTGSALPMVIAVSSGVDSQFDFTQTGSSNYYDAGGIGVGADLGYYSSFIRQTTGVAPVPEPATLAAFGFGALALLRRRRRA